MTFCSYCREIKSILSIEGLTSIQAKRIMESYLTRTSVEEAAKKLKEKQA